ncbi:TPA: DUF2971 domain-containing protein [Serratia fonticola]
MALIYHYCGPQTFVQLIENSKIWLSSTKNMNDFAEGEWFAKAYQDFLNHKRENLGDEFCNFAWSHFNLNMQPKYITCFSKNGDSLSQWRAYAQDGEGVSIGFDASQLGAKGEAAFPNIDPHSSLMIANVRYMSVEQIHKALDKILNISLTKKEGHEQSFDFATNCIGLFMLVKNPAFSEEEETRLIYSPLIIPYQDERKYTVENNIGNFKHRISNGYLTSHFEYEIDSNHAIKEIILGPKNKFSSYDVGNILGFKGLKKVHVRPSIATYR